MDERLYIYIIYVSLSFKNPKNQKIQKFKKINKKMIAGLTTALATFCIVSTRRNLSRGCSGMAKKQKYCISIEDVREAMNRIRDRVHRAFRHVFRGYVVPC